MSGKPKSMSQIKQLIQLHQQGKAIKEIARILGMSKNTVKSYLKKIAIGELDTNELLQLEDPVLLSKFHAGSPSYKQERYEHLKQHVSFYLKELKRVGVTKQLLWEEYIKSFPQGYGRSQFCFHLCRHQIAANPSMVMRHNPADKLFIDYAGKKL